MTNLLIFLCLQYSVVCKHVFEIFDLLSLKPVNVPQRQLNQRPASGTVLMFTAYFIY